MNELNVEYSQISYENLCEDVVREVHNILSVIGVSKSDTAIIESSECLSIIRNKKDEKIRWRAMNDKEFQSLITERVRV